MKFSRNQTLYILLGKFFFFFFFFWGGGGGGLYNGLPLDPLPQWKYNLH